MRRGPTPPPGARAFGWELPGEEYEAQVTANGVSYLVDIDGPAGGVGMAGFQSLEEFLTNGPLNLMPETIAQDVREHIRVELDPATRSSLTWEFQTDPAIDAPLIRLIGEVNGATRFVHEVVSGRAPSPEPIVLFAGTVPKGTCTLGLFAAFAVTGQAAAKKIEPADTQLELEAGRGARFVSRVCEGYRLLVRRFDRPSDEQAQAARALCEESGGPFDADDFPAAEALVRRALAIDQTNLDAWLILIQCRIYAGDLAGAAEVIDSALAADPTAAEYYYHRATTHSLAGREAEARRDVAIALELAPEDADAFCVLAEIELRSGHFGAAITALEQALELDPSEQLRTYVENTKLYDPIRSHRDIAELLRD